MLKSTVLGAEYFSRDTSPSGGVLERIAEQFNNRAACAALSFSDVSANGKVEGQLVRCFSLQNQRQSGPSTLKCPILLKLSENRRRSVCKNKSVLFIFSEKNSITYSFRFVRLNKEELWLIYT